MSISKPKSGKTARVLSTTVVRGVIRSALACICDTLRRRAISSRHGSAPDSKWDYHRSFHSQSRCVENVCPVNPYDDPRTFTPIPQLTFLRASIFSLAIKGVRSTTPRDDSSACVCPTIMDMQIGPSSCFGTIALRFVESGKNTSWTVSGNTI